MDLSSLGTLAATIEPIGGPILADLFTAAATAAGGPLAGMAVKGVSSFVLKKIGDALGTSDDPAAIDTAIASDPAKAAPIIQQVETEHADLIRTTLDAANRELEIRTADVQDARATEAKLAAARSPLQWGPLIVSGVIIAGYAACCVVPLPHDAVQAGMYETIKLLAVTVASFWLGSSTGSRAKDDHLADLARAPTVQAQPGSHVSSGVITGGKR